VRQLDNRAGRPLDFGDESRAKTSLLVFVVLSGVVEFARGEVVNVTCTGLDPRAGLSKHVVATRAGFWRRSAAAFKRARWRAATLPPLLQRPHRHVQPGAI
jgi:hypothetical protein